MTIQVAEPGLLTTVQDRGRWGSQALGVPVAGPMDGVSHRIANLLVGNPPDSATLEVTLVGPTIEFLTDATFAVAGAEFELRLDARAVPTNTQRHAGRGSRLRFGRRGAGAPGGPARGAPARPGRGGAPRAGRARPHLIFPAGPAGQGPTLFSGQPWLAGPRLCAEVGTPGGRASSNGRRQRLTMGVGTSQPTQASTAAGTDAGDEE